jgi:arabinan endo-1,5-alpha-L-arabinosidase
MQNTGASGSRRAAAKRQWLGRAAARLLLVGLGLVATREVAAAQQRPPQTGPTTDLQIHDPVMAKEGNTYYAFGTGISVASSTDMKTWTPQPPVFATAPAWAATIAEGGGRRQWAPDIYRHNNRWYLYYSISAFGRNTSAIGVASTPTLNPNAPGFGWTDHGMVVQSVPGRDMWNAIDPQVTHDAQGRPWLLFGSFWGGLKITRLKDSLTALSDPQEWHTIAARERYWRLDERDAGDAANPQLKYDSLYPPNVMATTRNMMNGSIEAPFVFRKGDWYYLFVSWDRCCRGVESTYKVVVGRSKEITGPYLDKEGQRMDHGGGSAVVGDYFTSARFAAGGHNSVYTLDGKDFFVMHAYDRNDQGRSKLVIREIEWDAGGWPVVWLKE